MLPASAQFLEYFPDTLRGDLVAVFERLIERVNKTYLECIGAGPLPARTTVGVSNITRGALIEMDFVVRTGA